MRKPRSGVYGEMRRRTEPSKLLSNEPQASCSNSRSGKFPRRPCCSSLYLLVSLSLSLFLLFALSIAKSHETHTYACTALLLRHAIYLLCMRALSSDMFSIFFAIAFLLPPSFLHFSWCSVLAYRDFFPLPFIANRVCLRVREAG